VSEPRGFSCNLCGGECPPLPPNTGREVETCPNCKSTVRLRGIAALLSQELFDAPLALTDFPMLKSVRAAGMSDPPELASRLAEIFNYTNTFYHQPPHLDITQPDESELGRYDFILSSEVMEHVPGPVERSFANLYRMLKPDGFLVLTVPYRIDGKTIEHFPELHEYTLATLGGRTVLVNCRRDGTTEVFENLCFHGGDGSTLEMRVFSEESLKGVLRGAGFGDVHIASENVPEFGVIHSHPWSLPVIARKTPHSVAVRDIALAYRDARRSLQSVERQLCSLQSDYQKYIEFHERSQKEMERDLADRTEWARKMESDLEERTKWAHSLEKENENALREFNRVQASETEAWEKVRALERDLAANQAALNDLRRRIWIRLGRKLGMTP
jgi:SAM-dependent methyltransferase